MENSLQRATLVLPVVSVGNAGKGWRPRVLVAPAAVDEQPLQLVANMSLLPSLSFRAGQLAADLLINTLQLPRVARLQVGLSCAASHPAAASASPAAPPWSSSQRCAPPVSLRMQDDALLQAVGAQPYSHAPGLATAFELYQRQPGDVAVAQHRAPAAPGTQAAFAERLAAFVKEAGVKEVRSGPKGGAL